jgi:hypothetical protein
MLYFVQFSKSTCKVGPEKWAPFYRGLCDEWKSQDLSQAHQSPKTGSWTTLSVDAPVPHPHTEESAERQKRCPSKGHLHQKSSCVVSGRNTDWRDQCRSKRLGLLTALCPLQGREAWFKLCVSHWQVCWKHTLMGIPNLQSQNLCGWDQRS